MTYDPLQIGEILAGVYATKVYNPKQNLLVDTSKHSPLLRFSADITNLLKPHDRTPVQRVVQALNERCLRVYLGGSAVENALRGKPRQYGDVDLLVTGEHCPIHDIELALNTDFMSQLNDAQDSMFDYPGRKFTVRRSIGTHQDLAVGEVEHYFNLLGVRRYTLTPSGKATPIDVAITPLDMFELQRVREL